MDTGTRWVALAAILGLSLSFIIWGRPSAMPPPQPNPIPAATGGAPIAVGSAMPSPAQSAAQPAAPANFPPTTAHGRTRLTFSPDTIDFGLVPLHESRAADVQVSNPTDTTIRIRDLDVSCGCIQASAEAKEIEPGKSASIHVNFVAPAGKKNESTVRVVFYTDEPGQPKVAVEVHAKVKVEFHVEPTALNFKELEKGQALTLDAVVRSDDGKPFTIKTIVCEKTEFTFKWELPAGGDGSSYSVHATMKGQKGGTVTDAAAILTDRPANSTAQLNLIGTIKQDLAATPSSVALTKEESKKMAAFTTVLNRKTPGRLEILSVVEGTPAPRTLPIDYEVERLSEESVRLSIKFKAPFPERAPIGHFEIKTNVEEHVFFLPFKITGKTVMGPAVKK